MTQLELALPVVHAPDVWRRRLVDGAIATTPLLVGGATSLVTMDGLRIWYRTIRRPDWNPPDWVFGPVWTTLYLMMGVALVQVARAERDRATRAVAIGLFVVQLALNAAWSWIFFTNHAIGAALVEVLALWLAIVATIVAFGTIRRSAAALLLPYLAWTTFATVLTATIWRLNR